MKRVRRKALLEFTRAFEQSVDALFGIRTFQALTGDIPNPKERNQFYEAVSYLGLDAIGRRLVLRPDDVVYDLGCGMGRIACWFARRPIARAVGVEIDGDLAAIARRNVERLRGRRAPIAIHQGDAIVQDYADGTLFFLFNPFSDEVLRPVVARIGRSHAGRRLRFVYVNPLHGYVLDEAPWLRRIGEPFTIPHFHIRTPVQMWESVDETRTLGAGSTPAP